MSLGVVDIRVVVPDDPAAPTIAVPRKGTPRRPRVILDGAAVRVLLALRPVVPIETDLATLVVRGADEPLTIEIPVQGDVRVHPSRSYARGPQSIRVDEPFDCEVVVTNDGSSTLRNGVLRVHCGEGLRILVAPDRAWYELHAEQRVLAWPLELLDVGGRASLADRGGDGGACGHRQPRRRAGCG